LETEVWKPSHSTLITFYHYLSLQTIFEVFCKWLHNVDCVCALCLCVCTVSVHLCALLPRHYACPTTLLYPLSFAARATAFVR